MEAIIKQCGLSVRLFIQLWVATAEKLYKYSTHPKNPDFKSCSDLAPATQAKLILRIQLGTPLSVRGFTVGWVPEQKVRCPCNLTMPL